MTAKLILTFNGKVLGEYPINQERTTIGRKPTNAIQVDNLAVSGEHAAILTILNDSFLEDLNSTNGTYVNGKRVKKHALKNGDVIGVGKHDIKYVNDMPTHDDAYEKTMIMRPPVAPKEETVESDDAGLAAQGAGGSKVVGGASLQILNGPRAGKTMELVQELTKLGKAGSQVAVITRRPHGYFLTHLEGDRPTLVNGEAIGTRVHELSDHDVIEIAGVKIEFYFT